MQHYNGLIFGNGKTHVVAHDDKEIALELYPRDALEARIMAREQGTSVVASEIAYYSKRDECIAHLKEKKAKK